MEKCYEYFNCNKVNCARRKRDDLHCWEIEDHVQCEVHSDIVKDLQVDLGSRAEACKLCIYYKQNNKFPRR